MAGAHEVTSGAEAYPLRYSNTEEGGEERALQEGPHRQAASAVEQTRSEPGWAGEGSHQGAAFAEVSQGSLPDRRALGGGTLSNSSGAGQLRA